MKAYKLVRKKANKLYPLFIDRNREYIIGENRKAEYIPTKGFAPRKGFHCCFIPFAPHLKTNLKSGEHRVWVECDIANYQTYERPESQGGEWILAQDIVINRELSFEEVENILNERQ